MMEIAAIAASRLSSDHVEAWSELLRAHPAAAHPLLGPRWTQLVAEVCPAVEVGVLREGGAFVGFFPFERIGRRTARPVAGGMSDLHGLVADPQREIDIAGLLAGCSLSTWSFDHLPVEQIWFAPYVQHTDAAAVIELVEGADRWWQQRLQRHAAWTKQLERKSRKLHRELGPLRLEWNIAEPAVLAALIQWKQWRLSRSGFRDVFQADWLRELLPRVCREQSPEFAGIMSALYAGPRLVAAHLGLRGGSVLSSWIPAYDPELARYSAGAILHVELARRACLEGVSRIELGRGLNPLKQALANRSVELAIGAVDFRPSRRWLRARWSQARRFAAAAPLGERVIGACRRVRNWLAPPS